MRAYAALLRGPEAAGAWLSAHPAEVAAQAAPANESLLLMAARLMSCVGRAAEATALLERLVRFAEDGGRKHILIQAKVALTSLRSQPDALLDALRLAEPEGYISTFTMEGRPLTDMLQSLLRRPKLEPHLQAYARKLLSAFEPPRKASAAQGLIEPLSEREIEVLRHIAAGLTNPEIARRLYLSPNTLKAHTQNIFLKLDVHNRLQAVSKAKELGII